MRVRTLEDLTRADERSLVFGPLGLSTGGKLTPEAAVAHQREVIARAELADGVPEDTRAEFDRLRELHVYGVLWYDAFTLVYQHAPIVLDGALRERFLNVYAEGVPLVRDDRSREHLHPTSFDEFFQEMRRRRGKNPPWKLALTDGGSMAFTGGFRDLVRWARTVGLLHGQRNRGMADLLVESRNRAAHPEGHQVDMPVESAQRIRDVGEIINRLWGATTPGGRLYPEPVTRVPVVIGWSPAGGGRVQFRANPDPANVDPSMVYIVLLGVEDDQHLWDFDSRFEKTLYPAELLFGPASWQEVASWLREDQPVGDEVEYLDRLFLVRSDDDHIDHPRRPEVALGLPAGERVGSWQLIRADRANDAFLHVRGPGGSPYEDCSIQGECPNCPVDVVVSGGWEDVLPHLDAYRPDLPREVRVPSPYG